MRYTVNLSARVAEQYEIEAKTPHEAVLMAYVRAEQARKAAVALGVENVPKLRPHRLNEEDGDKAWEFLGWCDGCDDPILEGDPHSDDEGCMTCPRCMPDEDDGCVDPVESAVGPEPTDYE